MHILKSVYTTAPKGYFGETGTQNQNKSRKIRMSSHPWTIIPINYESLNLRGLKFCTIR